MPKGFVSEYINLDRKSYNALKQKLYRKLAKCSERSIGVVCSGGGGVEAGAIMAGIRPSWGIDVNPTNRTKFNLSQMCSDYNELNHGNHVIRRSLLDIDISKLEETDIIWASLPCDRFTSMNKVHGKTESDLDISLSNKLILIIARLNPQIVCLENVPWWANSESFQRIVNDLNYKDYKLDYRDYNFSHYHIL